MIRQRQRGARFDAQAGLTLVELMIATVVSGIAISAALAMGYSMMNGYGDHRRTTRVMRAARASLDIMSNAIRNASPAITNNLVFVSIDGDDSCRGQGTPAVDVLNTNPAAVVDPDDDPDEVTLIYAAGGVLTTLSAPFNSTSTSLSVLDNTGFRDNDLALIVDVGSEEAALIRVSRPITGLPTELDFGRADGNTANSPVFSVPPCPILPADPADGTTPVTFPATSLVIRARAERFYIDDSGDVPLLMVDPFGNLDNEDPQPLALGIEDMQIVVGVDNGQGTGTPGADGSLLFVGAAANDDEVVFNVGGDNLPTAHDRTAAAWRALRLTLTARSVEEPTSGARGVRAGAEDRPAGTTQDRHRRRVLRTVVELRNLSP